MNLTLEQARTLVAFARAGTLQAAAKQLHKGHSSVLYGLKQLELQTGLTLFDRSGYRTRLTPEGESVRQACEALLDAQAKLEATCLVLRSGWEPVLNVVLDAIVPLEPVFRLVKQLRAEQAPTKVMVSVDSLAGVEARFENERAQLMVSVLELSPAPGRVISELPKLEARLVVHRRHPLAALQKVTPQLLAEHVLLTVRGSDPRLQLPTAPLEGQSTVQVSDFHAKKAATLAGLGFGWLPLWLCQRELESGELRELTLTSGRRRHVFEPRACARGTLGRAGQALLEALQQHAVVAKPLARVRAR